VEKIAVFPTAPYYSFIIYENLAIFWIAILILIVIIRMKLREIERVQEMNKEDKDAPRSSSRCAQPTPPLRHERLRS
jgi:hypothetical protein